MSSFIARQLARPSGWFGRFVMPRVFNRGNRALIEAALAGLPLGESTRFLDIGFGGGLGLELAAARGVRELAGIDPSPVAVQRLRARPPASLRGGNLRVVEGAVEHMPFSNASFDAILSTNTVYFWPDLARAFAELARVLTPGGQLALGFSSQAKLQSFGAITRHGFLLREDAVLVDAAKAAGLEARLIELAGGALEGDRILVARRPA